MTLADYMEAEGFTDAAMGAKLGELDPKLRKSRVTVGRYRRGLEPIPSDVVKRLVEMSGGRMTANELIGIEIEAEAAE